MDGKYWGLLTALLYLKKAKFFFLMVFRVPDQFDPIESWF